MGYPFKMAEERSSTWYLTTRYGQITVRSVEFGCTCERALAPLLSAGDGQELVGEQVQGSSPAVRVRLEAAQDERLGLQRHGLWDLWVNLKHPHLEPNGHTL